MSKTEIVTYEVTAPDGSLIEVKGPKGQESRAIEEPKEIVFIALSKARLY